MRTTKPNQLLFLFLLAAVVTLLSWHSSKSSLTAVCQKETPALRESAGTQLLWESLSRQFVSVKAY